METTGGARGTRDFETDSSDGQMEHSEADEDDSDNLQLEPSDIVI